MDRIKVLQLTSSYPRYEGDYNGIFINNLAIRLKDVVDVIVLSPHYKGDATYKNNNDIKEYTFKQFPVSGVEIANGNPIMSRLKSNKLLWFAVPFFILNQFFQLRKVVKKEKVQIIHAHWLVPQGFVAVIYKILLNKDIKVLGAIHGTDINGFTGRFGRLLLKFILKNVDELTAISSSFNERLKNLGYKKKVFVLRTTIDTDQFSPDKYYPDLKEHLNIKGKFILFVGSLIKNKGVDILVKAMPEILTVFPDAKLVIAGSGQFQKEIVDIISKLGISSNIIFLGVVNNSDLPQYYATADIFVLPSYYEGLGGVVTEAMSCGALVIVSKLKAFEDRVIEDETGFYLKDFSISDLATKMIRILKNENDLVSVRNNARELILENYSWTKTINGYKDLFKKLL